MTELGRRLSVAAVGIPLCVAAVWWGGLVFASGLALLAGVAGWEYVRMFRRAGHRPFYVPVVVGAAAFPILVFGAGLQLAWVLAPVYVMAVTAYGLRQLPPEDGPMTAAALTMLGMFYVGGLLSFAVPFRSTLVEGRLAGTVLFFLPVAVTWVTDTAAYFGGKSFGRRPLAPRVSPNKTVAGAVSALVGGAAAGLLYGAWILGRVDAALEPIPALLLGLVVAGAAVLGDLVESAMKRECGVKDASSLLPGHGGLLDRMDSLLWAFPVAYGFLLFT